MWALLIVLLDTWSLFVHDLSFAVRPKLKQFLLLWQLSCNIPAAFHSSKFLWPSVWISISRCAATCWCGSTASGEHIKRTQCLWNQIFQASFLGSWTLMDLISTAEVSILRWTALSWVSLWNLSEQKCYFQQKSDRFSPRAGDENGALWAPGDGFKLIAAEKWAAMHKNLRRKKIETSAFLKLAFIIHP